MSSGMIWTRVERPVRDYRELRGADAPRAARPAAELAGSRATWKVIASAMPIGLIVWNNGAEKRGVVAVADGDHGLALGRKLDFADLLQFIKSAGAASTV